MLPIQRGLRAFVCCLLPRIHVIYTRNPTTALVLAYTVTHAKSDLENMVAMTEYLKLVDEELEQVDALKAQVQLVGLSLPLSPPSW